MTTTPMRPTANDPNLAADVVAAELRERERVASLHRNREDDAADARRRREQWLDAAHALSSSLLLSVANETLDLSRLPVAVRSAALDYIHALRAYLPAAQSLRAFDELERERGTAFLPRRAPPIEDAIIRPPRRKKRRRPG